MCKHCVVAGLILLDEQLIGEWVVSGWKQRCLAHEHHAVAFIYLKVSQRGLELLPTQSLPLFLRCAKTTRGRDGIESNRRGPLRAAGAAPGVWRRGLACASASSPPVCALPPVHGPLRPKGKLGGLFTIRLYKTIDRGPESIDRNEANPGIKKCPPELTPGLIGVNRG